MSFDRSAPKLSVLIVLTLCLLLAVGYPFLGRALSAAGVTAMFCDTVTEIPTSECNALVALYNATGGGSWTVNADWLITSTPCSWFGVECDVTPYPYPGLVPYPADRKSVV